MNGWKIHDIASWKKIGERKCGKCGETKRADAYYKHSTQCKACDLYRAPKP